jgi:ubiquinone/menaquinone biosynthesis C-methylase UbiE
MDNITVFFDELSVHYQALCRYTPEVVQLAVKRLTEKSINKRVHILDLGGGDGYPAEQFLIANSEANLTLLDNSVGMLKMAQERLYRFRERANFVQGDMNQLGFHNKVFDVVFSCCSLHFVLGLSKFLQDIRSTVCENGSIAILFNDRADLSMQLFHQFFPAFHQIEIRRHHALQEVYSASIEAGLNVVDEVRFPYYLQFPTRDSFINFISSKPFSGFGFMGDNEFSREFENFTMIANSSLPETDIQVSAQLTLIVMEV